MKKKLFTLLLALVAIAMTGRAQVVLNETNFPDANFRAALAEKFGISEGDEITAEMIAETTVLNVSKEYGSAYSEKIADLTGIEYFTALTELYCCDNKLTFLDISQNTALTKLEFYNNYELYSIDVSKNTELTSISCYAAALTSLDVSQNIKLKELNCGSKLTSLNVSGAVALEYLSCVYSPLTSLDVSQNTALKTLICYGNQLSLLNVSGCSSLERLSCNSNKLTTLDLSQNTALKQLDCSSNQLTSLDLSNNTALTSLSCGSNQIAALNLSNQTNCWTRNVNSQYMIVQAVHLADGRLGVDLGAEGYDATRFTELKGDGTAMTAVISGRYLIVAENTDNCPSKVTYKYNTNYPTATTMDVDISLVFNIFLKDTYFPDANFRAALASQLDISEGAEITVDKIISTNSLNVRMRSIADLTGIKYFPALTDLDCEYNLLTSLDVSKNTALRTLRCGYNLLTSLNVSQNTALRAFYYQRNLLTTLDLSNNEITSRNTLSQQLTSKAVRLSDGRIGIDLREELDVARFLELKADGTEIVPAVNGKYLIIAEKVQNCPSLLTYEYDTKSISKVQSIKMSVEITIDASDLPTGILLDAINFPDANFRAALASILKISEGDEITDEMIQKRKIMNVSGKNISDFTGIEYFTALTTLNCSGNQICGEAMDALIASLPTVEDGTFIVIDTDDESEGNVITKSQVAAAKAKGWTVYDANYDEYEGSEDPVSETEIVLQRKYMIHNGSSYNEPAVHLDFGNGQVLHVGYLDTGWWGDYNHTMHGVYLIAGEDWVKASGENVWRVASTIKDQWVTEKLIVDFDGKVQYYMNGELMGEHTFPGLDLSEAKDMSLDFSPFGWWTGHRHYMDDFSLTTPLASVSDDFNDGVLDADLWQEPVNPDGVREEDGILKMEMLVTDWDYHLKTKTPIPLRMLSENKMFLRMGDTKTAEIFVEGECSVASGNDEIATAVINGDKVEITGVAEGKTTITVTHNESGKSATIDVTVTAGLLLIEGFFPDANFRAALASKFGIEEGDLITDEMIAGATQFSFSNRSIADVTGVEYFTELRYLYIYGNQIAKLDVSMLSKLISLDVDGNQLTELDITKNTALASLDCRNNQLTELDLSQNTALRTLYCFGNKLTELDVTQNTELQYLACYNNQLTELDVTQNTALQTLNCRTNRLTELDVTQNTLLTSLDCYNNQLTALDVTQNTALTYLSCYYNQLTALDVTKNTELTRLDCNYNQLTELDLSKNTLLTTLYCGNNQFAELDLSNQTNLGTRSVSTQYLATKAVKLADGRVGIDLGVEGFDWSRVSELKGDGTEMEAVFSGQYLIIADNVNDSPGKLTYQYDTQYPTEATTMEVIVTVDLSEFPSGILLNEENFPDANFRAALASKFGIDEGDELSMSHIRTTSISVSSRSIKDLTGIEHFTVLESLSAYYNQITNLDVSMLSKLRSLDVDGNQLTELDLSKNSNLTFLDCRNNQLTSLDLSKNTNLTGLICYGNQFVVLDLSNQQNNLSDRSLSTQYRTAKAVKLADGRIGIDLGVSGIDVARFTEMDMIDEDEYGDHYELEYDGTVDGHYLVIADKADECPNEVTYQFNTNYPVSELLMGVLITIDKSNLSKLVLLDNDEGEEYNNPLRIADYVGETIDVVIEGRKLLSNGNWNTVCLPFGVNADELDGLTVKELVGSSYTDATKTLTLDFVDATEMVAGKPYLLRATEPLELYEVGYLESDNKTISDAPAAVIETECVDFVGLYSTFDIPKKDRTLLFMGGDSKLYYPSGAMKIGAFRGYFRLKNGLTAGDLANNGAKEIVLNFGGGDATGVSVSLIDAGSANDSWYTIDGRKLNSKPTAKGVYIKNGKKIAIK